VSAPIGLDVHGEASDVPVEVCRAPVTHVVADSAGSNAPKPHELALSSQSDCVLLNNVSTPAPAPDRAPSVEIVDPAVASPLHAAARQWHLGYERNRHWQDSWAARLPWVESSLGRDGRVTQVRCKVCSEVEGREKLLAPKIDLLWKHVGRRRALTSIGTVKKGDHYS
jgi:hypothetical protein